MIKFQCKGNKSVFEARGVTDVVLAQSIAFIQKLSEWINEKEKEPEVQKAYKELFIMVAEKIISNGNQGIVELLKEMLDTSFKEAKNEQ